MKVLKIRFLAVLASVLVSFGMMAQINLQPNIQNYRLPGFKGLNDFDNGMKQRNSDEFEGIAVRVGADFALQFQSISHESGAQIGDVINYRGQTRYYNGLGSIGSSVNLPTANLNIDAQLAKGVRVHLRTYLSSKHHNETWVKGGYIMVNSLDFIQEGLAENFMRDFSVRIGQDNFNYGDAVSRRTDNAAAIYNPFVGNYIMDMNTVEPFVEFNYYPGDFLVVLGASTGILNPTVVVQDNQKYPPSFHGKLGWDSQMNDDLRLRLTGSFYTSNSYNTGTHLYNGDRAGSRYYNVFDYNFIAQSDSSAGSQTNDFSGRFNPGIQNGMAFQINPFVKFKGLEFFGIYEMNSGWTRESNEGGTKAGYTQLGAELLYRFGSWEQFYVAGRFNQVSGAGDFASGGTEPETMSVNRINIGAGWFMTQNTLVKLEYVTQTYNDQFSGELRDANMNGVVLEAVIGF